MEGIEQMQLMDKFYRPVTPERVTWYRARYLLTASCTANSVFIGFLKRAIVLALSVQHVIDDAAHVVRVICNGGDKPVTFNLREIRKLFECDSDPRSLVYIAMLGGGNLRRSVLSKAADMGDSLAQAELADKLVVRGMRHEALVAIVKSVMQDDPEGWYVGYKAGLFRNVNICLERAAHLGHPFAQYYYANRFSSHTPESFLWLGLSAEVVNDDTPTKAFLNAMGLAIQCHRLSNKTIFQIGASTKRNFDGSCRLFNQFIPRVSADRINNCINKHNVCIKQTKDAVRASCHMMCTRGRLNRDVRDIICRMIWKTLPDAHYI